MANFKKEYIVYGVLAVIIGFLAFHILKLNKEIETRDEKIAYYDTAEKEYVVVYDDAKINELKKENEELYSQIKQYKKDIDYLVQFKNTTVYVTDTVFIDSSKVNKEETKVYEYTNTTQNDTLNYNLKIGSTVEPDWYKLQVEVSEEFTIVNRKTDGDNITTITPSNGGTISDVTVHKQKQSNFLDNFGIGPSITAGYGLVNRQFDVVVGVSVIYNIPLKRK